MTVNVEFHEDRKPDGGAHHGWDGRKKGKLQQLPFQLLLLCAPRTGELDPVILRIEDAFTGLRDVALSDRKA